MFGAIVLWSMLLGQQYGDQWRTKMEAERQFWGEPEQKPDIALETEALPSMTPAADKTPDQPHGSLVFYMGGSFDPPTLSLSPAHWHASIYNLATFFVTAPWSIRAHLEVKTDNKPDEHLQTLMYESENLRQCQGEIDRFWNVDQPSHLTADGAVLPPLPARITAATALVGGIGCVVEEAQKPTSNATHLMDMLMCQSDSSGMILPPSGGWFSDCWGRMSDQPSHLTPDRTHVSVR